MAIVPIHDDNPSFSKPYVLWALLAFNTIAWLFLQGAGLDDHQLSKSIANFGISGDAVLSGEFYRFITHAFLHGSWSHFLFNMLFLWVFANDVEDAIGHKKFIVFYALASTVSSLPELIINPGNVPLIGASGAISAVMGAYLLMYPKVRVYVPLFLIFRIFLVPVPAILLMLFYLFFDVLGFAAELESIGQSAHLSGLNVAYGAHVIGFAFGFLAAFIFKNNEVLSQQPHAGWYGQKLDESNMPKFIKCSVDVLNKITLGVIVLALIIVVITK